MPFIHHKSNLVPRQQNLSILWSMVIDSRVITIRITIELTSKPMYITVHFPMTFSIMFQNTKHKQISPFLMLESSKLSKLDVKKGIDVLEGDFGVELKNSWV
jgi:aromatic ring-cleaving dioxygenase